MKCDICGKREATVHLTEVVNDKVTKLHLCEECAQAKSEEMQSHFGLSDLLSGLMDLGPSIVEPGAVQDVAMGCPVCKMTYYDFQKSGRLGCGGCYKTFEKNLQELLKKIHGSDKHVGKAPLKIKGAEIKGSDIKKIKQELHELIKKEEFEKAAILRDKIKDIEKKLEENKGDDKEPSAKENK